MLRGAGGRQADDRIRGMLWPLLAHVTGPAGAEGGALVEEALRLLGAVLAALPALPPEFQARSCPSLQASPILTSVSMVEDQHADVPKGLHLRYRVCTWCLDRS